MIFASALKSLKRDFYRSFFYWLTFMLTTAFVFLFFCIAVSPAVGMTFRNSQGGLAVNVTFFAVFVCMVDVFFANDFFVRTKAKDLAVQLICGAGFSQLAGYLLIQTFLLLALAIPVGVVLALALRPLLEVLMTSWLQTQCVIPISGSAVSATLFVLLTLVFWTTYLNLSYAYRNNAYTLLNSQSIRSTGSVFNIAHTKKAAKISNDAAGVFALILWLAPMLGILNAPADAFVFALFGMTGFYLCCRHVFEPLLSAWLDRKAIDKAKPDCRTWLFPHRSFHHEGQCCPDCDLLGCIDFFDEYAIHYQHGESPDDSGLSDDECAAVTGHFVPLWHGSSEPEKILPDDAASWLSGERSASYHCQRDGQFLLLCGSQRSNVCVCNSQGTCRQWRTDRITAWFFADVAVIAIISVHDRNLAVL